MEHLSLYKKGVISFTYDEPHIIDTPIFNDSNIMQYLQENIKLERSYSIRDVIETLSAFPELQCIHSFASDLANLPISSNLLLRNHDLNYISFEYIHEMYYVNANVNRTETYTYIGVYSGHNNEVDNDILDYCLEDIIDLPIVLRTGIERKDNIERIYIGNVTFLTFLYEIIDYISLLIDTTTNTKSA